MNSPLPNSPAAPNPAAALTPVLSEFEVFIKAPGAAQGPLFKIKAVDCRCAVLFFLAQLGGDVSKIDSIRVSRSSGIVLIH